MTNESLQMFACVRLSNGRLETNFPQLVWLKTDVSLRECFKHPGGLNTLALNILQHLYPGNEVQSGCVSCSRRAMSLYEQFAEEILETMPEEGGNMPLSVVVAWAADLAANDGERADLLQVC